MTLNEFLNYNIKKPKEKVILVPKATKIVTCWCGETYSFYGENVTVKYHKNRVCFAISCRNCCKTWVKEV